MHLKCYRLAVEYNKYTDTHKGTHSRTHTDRSENLRLSRPIIYGKQLATARLSAYPFISRHTFGHPGIGTCHLRPPPVNFPKVFRARCHTLLTHRIVFIFLFVASAQLAELFQPFSRIFANIFTVHRSTAILGEFLCKFFLFLSEETFEVASRPP